MATDVSTNEVSPNPRRRIPRRWVLVGIAGLLVAAALVAPLALRRVNPEPQASIAGTQTSDPLMAEPMATPATSAPYASGETGAGSTKNDTDSASSQPWDRMIIRTGTMQLTVKDVGDSIQRVRAVATGSGGYVFSSEMRNEGEYTYATITLYVPAANFEQVLPQLRALGGQVTRVANESITSSDVTEEYTDLDSQLRNLRATEARMLALQARAERMEDILSIDRELRTVQGDIERIQGRMNYLGKRAEMSTLTIYLSPAMAPAPQVEAEPTWQPLKAAEDAWNASLEMLASATTALITAVVFLWWLVPIAAIAVVIAARARRRSYRVRGQEAQA